MAAHLRQGHDRYSFCLASTASRECAVRRGDVVVYWFCAESFVPHAISVSSASICVCPLRSPSLHCCWPCTRSMRRGVCCKPSTRLTVPNPIRTAKVRQSLRIDLQLAREQTAAGYL